MGDGLYTSIQRILTELSREAIITPQPLMRSLKKFKGSTVLSELDVHLGYWTVVLDEESSYLTTFNSPFGRFRFTFLLDCVLAKMFSNRRWTLFLRNALRQLVLQMTLTQEFQTFLGKATHTAPFIPNLSAMSEPLRNLLKKDIEFQWCPSDKTSFENINPSICQEVSLTYFYPNKKSVVQLDASLRGLGSALKQEGKAIAFASRALTTTYLLMPSTPPGAYATCKSSPAISVLGFPF